MTLRTDLVSKTSNQVDWRRFDAGFALVSAIFLAGLFVDGWAHFHDRVDESFFTPWHAVFYGGFLLCALYLFTGMLRGRRAGLRGRAMLPAGYDLTVAGILVFALGGIGDMAWHTAFGIEEGPEALFSTSHLTLAAGMFLVFSGPFRAAWRRGENRQMTWPAVVSATLSLTVVTFITSYANPLVQTMADGQNPGGFIGVVLNPALGMTAVLLASFFWMGTILLSLRRWTLPPGALAVLFGLNAAFLSVLEDEYRLVLPWLFAGLIGDILYARLKPGIKNLKALRWFAFILPVIAFGLYFAALQFTDGIWWRIHTWSGAMTAAGVIGVFVSFLVFPPPLPQE